MVLGDTVIGQDEYVFYGEGGNPASNSTSTPRRKESECCIRKKKVLSHFIFFVSDKH